METSKYEEQIHDLNVSALCTFASISKCEILQFSESGKSINC